MALGETLRKAREARGMTVAQVADSTHLMARQIEALEREDFSGIVAAIYGKGFIKLFAECVGVDPSPLCDEFAEIYNGSRPPRIARRTAPQTTAQPRPVARPQPRPVPVAEPPRAESAPAAPASQPAAPAVVPEVGRIDQPGDIDRFESASNASTASAARARNRADQLGGFDRFEEAVPAASPAAAFAAEPEAEPAASEALAGLGALFDDAISRSRPAPAPVEEPAPARAPVRPNTPVTQPATTARPSAPQQPVRRRAPAYAPQDGVPLRHAEPAPSVQDAADDAASPSPFTLSALLADKRILGIACALLIALIVVGALISRGGRTTPPSEPSAGEEVSATVAAGTETLPDGLDVRVVPPPSPYME